MANYQLTSAHVEDYERDGYVIVRNFIPPEEIQKLQEAAFSDGALRKHAFDLNDQTGKKTKLTL